MGKFDSIIRRNPDLINRLRDEVRGSVLVPEEPEVQFEPEVLDTVEDYLRDLRHGRVEYMMGEIYDTPESHYKAINSRVGELVSIISGIPEEEVIHAPGDGIGAVALACRILDRPYVSSEPNDLGQRARKLGIIHESWTLTEHMIRHPTAYYVFSHLSRFVDVSVYSSVKCVVYDQERYTAPGFEKLHWSGVLMTNDSRVLRKAYIVHYSRMPDITHQAVKLNTMIESVRQELEIQGKFDPESEIMAVPDKTYVLTGKEYVLAERRVAKDFTTRPGSTITESGETNFISAGESRVYLPRSMRLVPPKLTTTLLDHSYDLAGCEYVRVMLPFRPDRLTHAFSRDIVVRVSVLSVSEVYHTYDDGDPKMLYDVLLRASSSWIDPVEDNKEEISLSIALQVQHSALFRVTTKNYRDRWKQKNYSKKIKQRSGRDGKAGRGRGNSPRKRKI